MKKYFSKAQGISKFTRLSSIFITIGALSSSSIAYADVNGIPFNPDFPNAEYPYAQAPDACSGVTNRPDSNGEIRDTWGPVDFRGACNTHDKCYYTVGSNWNTCNERLYSDLRAACERDLKISFNVPAPTLSDPLRTRRVDGPPDPARLSACYTIASGYYAGVQGGVALGVFDKAQDKQKRYESWVASVKNPTSPISTTIVLPPITPRPGPQNGSSSSPSNKFRVRNRWNPNCLASIGNSQSIDNRVGMGTCDSSNSIWQWDGQQIRNGWNPNCLGSIGNSKEIDNPVVMGSCGQSNAVWQWGGQQIKNGWNPFCLGSIGNSRAVDNPVVMGACGQSNAEWFIEPIR